MKQRIGFMGLGIMGSGMAANVLKAGYPLNIYNRTHAKTRKLEGLGANVSASPQALVEACDIIVMMVTGPEAIENLLWGPEGAAQALERKKTLINMSTVPPRFTRELHQKLMDQGNPSFIDAPVSGTKKPAEDGTLLILASGDRQTVENFTPLLQTMGKKVLYCGEAGRGSMMKMTVNLLLGCMMEGLAESLHFGQKGGLSLDLMLEAVLSGPMGCGLYQMKSEMIRNEEYPVSFPLKHMTKDLKFVVDTGYEKGIPIPVAHTLLHLYSLSANRWGEEDFAAVAKLFRQLEGA